MILMELCIGSVLSPFCQEPCAILELGNPLDWPKDVNVTEILNLIEFVLYVFSCHNNK